MGTSGLGALLVEDGLLTEADRRTIKRTCGGQGSAFARGVIALGLLAEDELAAFLAEKTRWQVGPKELFKASRKEVWGIVDRPLIERLEVLPLRAEGQTLHVAMVDPLDQDTLKQLTFFTGYKIHPVIATLTDIRAGLKKLLKTYQPVRSQLEDFLENHAGSASRHARMAARQGSSAKRQAKPAPARREKPVSAPAFAVTNEFDDITAGHGVAPPAPGAGPAAPSTQAPAAASPPPPPPASPPAAASAVAALDFAADDGLFATGVEPPTLGDDTLSGELGSSATAADSALSDDLTFGVDEPGSHGDLEVPAGSGGARSVATAGDGAVEMDELTALGDLEAAGDADQLAANGAPEALDALADFGDLGDLGNAKEAAAKSDFAANLDDLGDLTGDGDALADASAVDNRFDGAEPSSGDELLADDELFAGGDELGAAAATGGDHQLATADAGSGAELLADDELFAGGDELGAAAATGGDHPAATAAAGSGDDLFADDALLGGEQFGAAAATGDHQLATAAAGSGDELLADDELLAGGGELGAAAVVGDHPPAVANASSGAELLADDALLAGERSAAADQGLEAASAGTDQLTAGQDDAFALSDDAEATLTFDDPLSGVVAAAEVPDSADGFASAASEPAQEVDPLALGDEAFAGMADLDDAKGPSAAVPADAELDDDALLSLLQDGVVPQAAAPAARAPAAKAAKSMPAAPRSPQPPSMPAASRPPLSTSTSRPLPRSSPSAAPDLLLAADDEPLLQDSPGEHFGLDLVPSPSAGDDGPAISPAAESMAFVDDQTLNAMKAAARKNRDLFTKLGKRKV